MYSSAHKDCQCYDPTTNRLHIAWHVSFFEIVPYYHSSHIQDLSFLNATTSTKSFTLFILIYTLSLLISTLPTHISLSKSCPSSVNVTTDTLLLMTAPTFSGDQHLPCQNSPRHRHPPAWYCASANTTNSLSFSSFVSTLHSLQEPKSNKQRSNVLILGILFPYHLVQIQWAVNAYTKSRSNRMVLLNGTRLVSLLGDSHRSLLLTTLW